MDGPSLSKLRKLSFIVLAASLVLFAMLLSSITFILTGGFVDLILVLPFCLALPFIRLSTISQLILQASGRWRKLVHFRLVSVTVTLLVLGPTLLLTKNIAVGASALAVAECTFVLLAKKTSRVTLADLGSHAYNRLLAQKKYTQALETQFGLWLRSQMDRVLVIALSNPKMIGYYFLSFTVARTPSETLSAGATRRLKSLELDGSSQDNLTTVRNNIILVQVFSVLFIALFACVEGPLLTLIPSHWNEVIRAIPVFLVATIPAALSASLFEVNFRKVLKSSHWPLYFISFLGASCVAVGLNVGGLVLAGTFLVLKETAASIYWFRKSSVPKGTNLGVQTFLLTAIGAFTSALGLALI